MNIHHGAAGGGRLATLRGLRARLRKVKVMLGGQPAWGFGHNRKRSVLKRGQGHAKRSACMHVKVIPGDFSLHVVKVIQY